MPLDTGRPTFPEPGHVHRRGSRIGERLLPQDETRTRAVRRVGPPRPGLEDSARRTAARTGIPVGALCAARLTRAVRQARQLVCPVAVRYLGSSGAAVARFLGVTTSAVTHAAWTEPIPGAAEFV